MSVIFPILHWACPGNWAVNIYRDEIGTSTTYRVIAENLDGAAPVWRRVRCYSLREARIEAHRLALALTGPSLATDADDEPTMPQAMFR